MIKPEFGRVFCRGFLLCLVLEKFISEVRFRRMGMFWSKGLRGRMTRTSSGLLILFLVTVSVFDGKSAQAQSTLAPRSIPRTNWDEKGGDTKPELTSLQDAPLSDPALSDPTADESAVRERSLGSNAASLKKTGLPQEATPTEGSVPADLQSLFDRAQSAKSVLELNSVIERCKNIAGDSTRAATERNYAKRLLSWGANRRGELRSDMAGEMIAARQLAEAEKLDQAALGDFQLAIENDPARWRAHHNLGVLLAIGGDFPNAIKAFTKTLELNPKFVEAYHNRGELFFRKGDFNSAIDDYTKGLALDNKNADLFSGRGNARFALGQIEAALADYQSAMTLAPDSAKAATEFADTCQSLGRWKEAAEAYQKALKADANHVRALQNAAWMMATCPEDFYRDPAAAAKAAQKALDTSIANTGTANPHLYHVLSMGLAAQGDFAKAVNTINQAIQSTDDPQLRREMTEHRALFQRKKTYLQPTPTN